ncbi:MAG: hypothetical protein SPK77_06040, partial [Lachnospiraceae bacterium]|nr:hypothetical protein [Lachnospiraceae bacterium]
MKKYNSKKHNRKDSLLKGVGAAGAVVGGAVLYSQGNVVYAAETTNTLEERGELEEKLDLQQSASESMAPESLLSTENQDSLSAENQDSLSVSESTSVSESESESQAYLDSETALEDQPAESKVTNVYMPLASFTKLQSVEIREDGIITIDGNNWQDYIEVSSGVTPEIIDGVDGQKYVKFTLTEAQNSQVGNIHLKNKIDMNSSFTIKGVVNLGNVSTSQDYGQTVIADGIGIAFHTGNTDQVGKTGANMGIGGIENATGFELDTYRNGGAGNASGSNYGWAPDNAAVYHVYNKGNAKEYTVVDKTEGYYGAAVKTYGVRWKDKSTFVLENGLTFTKKTGYDGDYYDVKKDSKGVAAFTALSNKQTYYYMFADSIVKMDGTNGSQNLTSTITEPNKTFDYELSYDGSSRTLKMVIKGGKDVTKEETYEETNTTYEMFDDSSYYGWSWRYGRFFDSKTYEEDATAAGYTIKGEDNRYYKAVTETVTKTRTVTTQEDLVLTTHVDSADEAMSLVISASTGAYNALQQFQINEMTYKAARSVDIKYVDENGNVIPNVKQAEIEYIKDETGERTGFQIKGQDIPGYKYLDVSIENETGNVNLVVDDWNNDGLKDARGSLTKPGNNATILFRYVSIEHFNSVSNSVSTSTSISDSISNSISTSTSVSNSLSESTSISNSLSDSTSTSTSLSESTSTSLSESESTSTSLSESESTSTSLSESESTSTSLSESESTSTSLSESESESTSTSLSESESTSTSLSESESTSTSLSESESTSTSLSESESTSTSLSESESTSTSLSESESTSTSLSESESTSTSLSESESTSTSLSESESTSTSISESESTSTSLSESESTSTSLSESESTSTSLSESESTSTSLSESESTSTSLSESESTSTSLSESESTSTSLSESESTSTSLSE